MKSLISFFMKLLGWRVVNSVGVLPKSYIMLVAPHTSMWDVPVGCGSWKTLKLSPYTLINRKFLVGPLGWCLRKIGMIGVDTASKNGFVDTAVQLFSERSDFVLAICPEGTRGRAEHWKTGFWHMASKSGVPIVLGYLDYATKTVGVGKILHPGDFTADMVEICTFYKQFVGAHPDHFSIDVRYS